MFDLIGSLVGAGASLFGASKQNKLAKDQMRHGVSMRVADANNAGIHPLAALGANIQPVSSQPLLGDAAIGGLREGIKSLDPQAKAAQEAQTKLTEAQTRNLDAQTVSAMAQSRTLAARVRQPLGATRGGNVNPTDRSLALGPHFGTLRPTGRYAPAQRVQDEIGDAWEQFFGTLNLFDMINSRSMRNRHRKNVSDYIRRGRRPRDWVSPDFPHRMGE